MVSLKWLNKTIVGPVVDDSLYAFVLCFIIFILSLVLENSAEHLPRRDYRFKLVNEFHYYVPQLIGESNTTKPSNVPQ